MYLYSYEQFSAGAAALSKAIPVRRIKHDNSKFAGNTTKVVINWGSSDVPAEVSKCRILNAPSDIRTASNKLSFFRSLEGSNVRIPEFTDNPNVARQWATDGEVVVARQRLTGSAGRGISFVERSNPNSFVEAPLYTKYIKKKDEFRVHFCNGEIIDVQRKALRPDFGHPEEINWRVRNLDNGFIFVRNNVVLPTDVTRQVENFIQRTPLFFGAIDIIYNEKQQQAYILEVNTAPGLVGTTVENYANAFKKVA